MSDSPPTIARTTFTIHVIVAGLIGLALLVIPMAFGAWFGYPDEPELQPVVRSFGAVLLGFGALTSFYGARAKSWQQVDYIVRGEITYLALQTVVYIVSLILGQGPVLGNVVFLVISVAFLVLFLLSWSKRPT